MPTRRSRSRSHAGDDSRAFTPRITRDEKIGQPVTASMLIGNTAVWAAGTGLTLYVR